MKPKGRDADDERDSAEEMRLDLRAAHAGSAKFQYAITMVRATHCLLLCLLVAPSSAQKTPPKVDSRDIAVAVDFVFRATGTRLKNPRTELRSHAILELEEGSNSCSVDTVTHRVMSWRNIDWIMLDHPGTVEKTRAITLSRDWLKKMKLPVDGVPEVTSRKAETFVIYAKTVNGYYVPGRMSVTLNKEGKVWAYSRTGMDGKFNKPTIKITAPRAEQIARDFIRKHYGQAPKSVKSGGLGYTSGGSRAEFLKLGEYRLARTVNFTLAGQVGTLDVDVENGKVYHFGLYDFERPPRKKSKSGG